MSVESIGQYIVDWQEKLKRFKKSKASFINNFILFLGVVFFPLSASVGGKGRIMLEPTVLCGYVQSKKYLIGEKMLL